ncbi:MAG: NAD(P)H-dependent oxidoreductase [Actinobacteria bacterium]|nr:NAD(P)H-dependent oxidoreductase [Actinomycetota bacterium]
MEAGTPQLEILALPGSLRAGSFTTRVLAEARRLEPPEMRIRPLEGLERLPFFNQDVEGEGAAPEPVRQLREDVRSADGLLLVTPEYNRSAPAVLKNAVDWCSRPRGEAALARKPLAVITASPGPSGGIVAFHHLRQIVHAAGAVPVGSKEFALPGIARCFDEQGGFADEEISGWIADLLAELAVAVAVTRTPAGF